ncbi:histone-lysine N-methyltransferase SETMAR [Elysia marginata]|uniref:Histone-lysine N-methyltransferase SETMAR n=1 Tax=Elysia marginata TaxID=1093978 RepID=A0AAV4JVF2_9GAST|nr:histone-lysine N-methyltransferase SETMAR [Elysia marginata]
MTLKHPSSPVTKKLKVQRSAPYEMATMFWHAKGVILFDILPQGQCINAAQHCSTLDRLRDAICHKRPGLMRKGFVLQHNNATPHSANLYSNGCSVTVGKFFLILPTVKVHTSQPFDFHLFGPLKCHLGGMAFKTEGDLIG